MSRQTAKRGLSFGRASDSPRMRSVTTDTQVLGARRVVHEMRASVFVARTVLLVMCWCASLSPLVLRLLWHLFMFLGREWTVAARWTYAKRGLRFQRHAPVTAITVTATGIVVSCTKEFTKSRELARAVVRADAIIVASLVSLPGSLFGCCSACTLRNFCLWSGCLLFLLDTVKDPR